MLAVNVHGRCPIVFTVNFEHALSSGVLILLNHSEVGKYQYKNTRAISNDAISVSLL